MDVSNIRISKWEQPLPAVAWDKRCEVGHPVLDAQHHHIVGLLNTLHYASVGEGLSTVDSVLRHFVRFVENHFETEEAILRQVEYPGVERHAAEHRALMRQLTKAVEAAGQDGHTADPVWFARTIWSWLHEHTVFSDQAFAPMLRSLGRADASGAAK